MEKKYIKPNPNKTVDGRPMRLRDPDINGVLPDEGGMKIIDNYWQGMIDRGQVLVVDNPASEASNEETSTETNDDAILEIFDAIEDLEEDNKDHWTKDGKPDAKELSRILGREVTAEERNQAWAEYNKED